ncbi:[acyl-carrier-protein] S-malonyltransferase [Ammoniphilus oxalaticus]|uniref:Malonyl CoA-acyl carrier protein transacylase n=1 Tax=Ammoniphilus oxalaticus TaxID=66863 RepID=A0A419SG02_9BACL|nr:ACP S-malonyltransferase [Ammoniphilus oxalaticus]RKD22710.1 [acyl-carrier-protein] S-malonyltransferase [Ammoniphilus oxalaticus]
MSKIAFLFPGQGSQAVGMGKDIAEQNPKAKAIFEKANEALGYDLQKLCFFGPEEELKVTYHTQPALVTTSIALLEAGKGKLPKPDFVAGHSLGEYSALVAAGVLSFEDAVYAVRQRGELMNDAVPVGQGSMAAVLGADTELIRETCEKVQKEGLSAQIANINCPGQIVISGVKEGVERVSILLKENGVKRVLPLAVSGPFHSQLMVPASERLQTVLDPITFSDALVPVVTNIDGEPKSNAKELEKALISQVYSSVQWERSIQFMIGQGVETFIEFGSGTVLTGLMRKIDRTRKTMNIFDAESLQQAIDELTRSSV